MFGRRKKSKPVSTARSRLRETEFPCRVPGVRSLRIEYDAAVWTRLPHEGEDRTDWVAAHLAAYAEDLSLTEADAAYDEAREALDTAADTLLTHTADFMALPHPELGSGTVAYVDVVDTELGLLEHNDPETFVTMADLRPEKPVRASWFPVRSDAHAIRASELSSVDPDTWRREVVVRGHRSVDVDGAEVHVYGSAFGSGILAPAVALVLRSRLELEDGRTL